MRPRTVAILLGLSLVLNVFVIGAFVGVFFGPAIGLPPPVGAARPNPMMAAADRLDPTDRDVFRALMQDEVQREGPTALDARLARRQAAELMRQPSFDRAAAGAALDRARADDMQVRQAVENAVLDFAARLDQRGRTTLSEGLGRAPGWLAHRAAGAASGQPPTPPPPHPQ
ncbi:MAG TPA: periplasmic heavy metal sensor [Caulobacteraceae bacterium]|nr:periplasmic heavy metal sensor [Caulobacteraceae bacterium]